MMTLDRDDDAKGLAELAALPVPDVSAEKARALRNEALTLLRKRTRRLGPAFPAWAPAALRLAARLAGTLLGTGWLYCAFRQAAQFLGV